MGLSDLSEFTSLPEYLDHQKDVRSQISALETEYKGKPFPEDVRPEYAELRKRDSDLEPIINELEARERYLSSIAGESGRTARGIPDEIINSRDARGTSRERDLYDIATLRGGLMGGDSGEIRDRATMQHALHYAESGHLCVSTLHAHNANQAVQRILNFFPEHAHKQLQMDLSLNLRAVIAQRLPSANSTSPLVPSISHRSFGATRPSLREPAALM